MVTITRTTDTGAQNLISLSTTETAEEFLDGIAGRYWGEPGFSAKRDPGKLTVSATPVGGNKYIVSTYTIDPQETPND